MYGRVGLGEPELLVRVGSVRLPPRSCHPTCGLHTVEGEDVGVLRVFLVLDVQLHRQSRSRMSLERSERGRMGEREKGTGREGERDTGS